MSGQAPPGWPKDVAPVSVEDLARLGISPGNELFWDGSRIEVRRRLQLTVLEKTIAILVSLFAILGGLGAFATGYKDTAEFLCARGKPWLSCARAAQVPPAKSADIRLCTPGQNTPACPR